MSLSSLVDTSPAVAPTATLGAVLGAAKARLAVKAWLAAPFRAITRRGPDPRAEPPAPCLDPYQIALAGLGSPLLSYGEWC